MNPKKIRQKRESRQLKMCCGGSMCIVAHVKTPRIPTNSKYIFIYFFYANIIMQKHLMHQNTTRLIRFKDN